LTKKQTQITHLPVVAFIPIALLKYHKKTTWLKISMIVPMLYGLFMKKRPRATTRPL
jgi:hypothetical protein